MGRLLGDDLARPSRLGDRVAVLPSFQGRGIASFATAQILDMARAEQQHRYVHAFPMVENGPSNAICRKLGFTLLGGIDFPARQGGFVRCNDWRFGLSSRAAIEPNVLKEVDEDDGFERDATIGIRLAQALHLRTDHRSQICTALTTLGVEPPSIDVWEFGEQTGRAVEVPPTS